MINVIICDDNDADRSKIVRIIDDYIIKKNIECSKHVFKDYDNNFLKMIDERIPFKIYILDIETPSRSGIDIARKIRKRDVESVIIFLTGHEELGNIILKNDLMFLSFINKFDDLKNRLNNSLNKAMDLINQKRIIRFNDRNILYTINMNDILYITKESFERKTIIKTDYSELKINKSLSEIVSMLDDRFIQTHRACYINTDRKVKVDKMNRIITFDNGNTIDLLSEKYKKEVC